MVACDLASSHAETYEGHILQVKFVEELVKVLTERVIVVARGGFAGLAEASTGVSDYSIASVEEGRELPLPASAAQRIPMDQYDWFARAMILVVKINIAGILFSNSHKWHNDVVVG